MILRPVGESIEGADENSLEIEDEEFEDRCAVCGGPFSHHIYHKAPAQLTTTRPSNTEADFVQKHQDEDMRTFGGMSWLRICLRRFLQYIDK